MPQPSGTVTLLFTDVVGSTELRERLGEDEADRGRRAHFHLLRRAIDEHGGSEVKTLGDGIMAAFSGAVDAARCAIRLQQSVHRYNETEPEDQRLSLRIGLDVGEPNREEADYFGLPVVVARRLCDSATGGQIIVSELVRSVIGTRGGLVFERIGPLSLKGIADDVLAWELEWPAEESEPVSRDVLLAPAEPALPGFLLEASKTSFTGREHEIARLRACWETVRSGTPATVMLSGEAGIGKTRLAEELTRGAFEEGAAIIFCRCDDTSSAPFAALADALRPWSASLAPVVRQLVERELDATAARGHLPQIVDGAASFVERLARARPAVVVLDDLQWADEAVLELLARLARIAAPAALLIIGCHRDVERDDPLSIALADLPRGYPIEQVRVEGLDRPAVESIVSAWAGRRDVRELADTIRERTEGNPLFIEELLLHLSDAPGGGTRGGSRLAIDELSVPEGVKDLIARRLTRLSRQCNSVLTVASVVGRAFDLDSLRRASDLETGELLDALEEAQSARIVEELPNNVGRYTFSHALVHETLYDELTTTRRVHLHGQTLRYADSNGAKLAFEVLGSSGPYLIAIGLANCPAVRPRNRDVRRHWDRIAESCQLILYDRRGLGFSSAPERGYGLQASVGDVRAVLEAAGATRAFLLGAVDGGPVALSLAVQYPECVAGLILASTTARLTSVDDFQLGVNPDVVASFIRTEAVDRARAASAAAGTRHGAADAQAIGEVIQRVPPHAWSKIIGAYGSSDARSVLEHVRVPTLILHDPENEFISVEAARYLHEHIPGSELEITTDCRPPHFGDRYYDRIAAFIHDALAAGGAGPRGE